VESEPKNTMSVFNRMVQKAIADTVSFGDDFDPCRSALPTLWHWLTCTEAGPDHIKEPAKLTIKATPGGFYASLADDTFGVSIDASAEHLHECFEALEKALTSPQPAIRTWPKHEVQLKKKKKKT